MMNKNLKQRRAKRVRSKIQRSVFKSGTPRLTVFRSNKYIYAQIIDDLKQKTLVSASEKDIQDGGTKIEKAKKVGQVLAEKALEQKIKKVVFDRGEYRYHGRIQALAEGAKEGGLII